MALEQKKITQTKWLQSPFTEKAERLQPMSEVVVKPYFGKRKKLKLFRTEYCLGSAPQADIVFDDPFVSPIHVKITLAQNGSGYFIEDTGSQNGTFLNGVRVQCAPLPAQGTLRIGRSIVSWLKESQHLIQNEDCIAADPAMIEILQHTKKIAKSSLSILLTGETGTGKEVLARLIHRWSSREEGPYVCINGALTGGSLAESELFGHQKGAFTGADVERIGAIRSAHGGTLFLDEVSDIPLSAQVKLLRALESGEVKSLGSDRTEQSDFRLISATSQNLTKKIEEKSFRLDLYYRIGSVIIHIPPLRERPKDIIAMARAWAEMQGLLLNGEVESQLLSYSWPGNVRELRATVERALHLAKEEGSGQILSHHLQGFEKRSLPQDTHVEKPLTLKEMERAYIMRSLERNGWSRVVAADELGIARSTLFEKMRRFKIRERNSLNY